MKRFFHLSEIELRKLNLRKFHQYVESMNRIEAHEMLLQMKIADYPNMKSESKTKFHRQTFKIANPNTITGKPVTLEQIAGILNRG